MAGDQARELVRQVPAEGERVILDANGKPADAVDLAMSRMESRLAEAYFEELKSEADA